MIKRIDTELNTRGWVRADLARHLGYSEQRLMNWWKRGIPASEHARIAKVFGWTIDHLITGRDVAKSPKQTPGNHTHLGADIDAFMAAATPRSRSALEQIAAAAANGGLSEADLIMLEQIAIRFAGSQSVPAANASHDKLRKRLRNDDTSTEIDSV